MCQAQNKYECEVKIMDEMKTSAEKLIVIIQSLSEAEAERLLYLVEGTRIGEAVAKTTAAWKGVSGWT